MVVDNADDTTIFFQERTQETPPGAPSTRPLAEYIPNSPTGSVLITTRDGRVGQRLANRNKPITVSPMTPTEAEDLLRSKVPDDELYSRTGSLDELLNELAFLPLAITQAAAFIYENNISISDYLDLLRAGDQDVKDLLSEHLEDPRRDRETENSVMRTWKLSFDQIKKQKPLAADILSLMAILDLQGVPKSLLRHYHHDSSEIVFATALGALQAFSLITVGRGKDASFQTHRLVQLSTQKWLELQGKITYWQAEALRILCQEFPWPKFEVWPICEGLAPHVQVVLSYKFDTEIDLLNYAKLLDLTSDYNVDMGKYDDAYNKGIKALGIRENLLQNNHPLVLQSVHTVGYVLQSQRNLPAAKEMLQRAATGRIEVLGPEDRDTLQSMLELADIMMKTGDLDAAEELCEKVLKGQEKLLGLDHPDTLASVGLFGTLMWKKGDLDKAEAMMQKALRGHEQVLGHDHPDIMKSIHQLALVRDYQGSLDAAIEMYRRVARTEERVLGLWHPERMVTVYSLANCLREKGDLEAAEDLNRDGISGCEKALGVEYPTTLKGVQELALTLRDKGEYVEATELAERAFTGQQKVLGAEHPDTLSSLHGLAYCKSRQGDYQGAEKLYEQALAGHQKVLGADHLHSLTTLRNLAVTILDQGPERYEDAEERYRQAALIGEKLQGEENPEVLSDLHHIAFSLNERGEHREAEVLNRRVLRLREKVLGHLHLDSILSVNNLAWSIQKQGNGRFEEAEELHRRAYTGYKQELGPESEKALLSLEYLRNVLNLQHKYDESEGMERLLISIKEKALGSEHHDVLVAYHNLAWNLSEQGKCQESEEIYRRVVSERDTISGQFHPDTLLSISNLARVIDDQGSERYEEAEKFYRRALEGYEQTLGPKSEKALESLEDLISLLEEVQDRPQEVSELRERLERLKAETEDSDDSSDEILEESLSKTSLVTSDNTDTATILPRLDDSCTSSTPKGAEDPITAVPRPGSDHDLSVLVPSRGDDDLPSSLSEPVRMPERLKQAETEPGI